MSQQRRPTNYAALVCYFSEGRGIRSITKRHDPERTTVSVGCEPQLCNHALNLVGLALLPSNGGN